MPSVSNAEVIKFALPLHSFKSLLRDSARTFTLSAVMYVDSLSVWQLNCGRPSVVTVDVNEDVAVEETLDEAVEVKDDVAELETEVVCEEVPVVVAEEVAVDETVDVAVDVCVVTSQLINVPRECSVRAVFKVVTSFKHSSLQFFLHPEGAIM